MRFLLAYVIAAVLIASALAYIGYLPKYYVLSRAGQKVEGAVVQPDCSNHNTFSYRFEANGRHFDGRGHGGIAKPCSSLVAGDSVQIYYLANDPKVNASGNPDALLRNEIIAVGLAATLVPAFAIASLVRFRRRLNAPVKA
jgi:hypothetical protein